MPIEIECLELDGNNIKAEPANAHYPHDDSLSPWSDAYVGEATPTTMTQNPLKVARSERKTGRELQTYRTALTQPETRSISHNQLVIEVRAIYAGLLMVESKCIDVDEKQFLRAQDDSFKREPLKNDQWQSLIALHKQLLHEHHDFFLASQHPSASSSLRKLAAKYSMPARMWRHGIHAFLEVLRHRLPDSLEHMLAFVYIAYSMMALLYETVSAFEDTWIECLGDLGRYRMAIEEDEPRDREVWSGVARFWYTKAADRKPNVGRLYHHLAILARPYSLEQLSFYTRSLTCVAPFESARWTIVTLLHPLLGRQGADHHTSSLEPSIPRAYGHVFRPAGNLSPESSQLCGKKKDQFGQQINEILAMVGAKFKHSEVLLAVTNLAALFGFGALSAKKTYLSSLLRNAMESWPRSFAKRFFRLVSPYSRPLLLASCLRGAIARPSPLNASPTTSEVRTLNNLLVDVASIFLVFLVPGVAEVLIRLKRTNAIPVYGMLTSTTAFGWWCSRNDAATPLVLLWSIFGIWCFSTVRFWNYAFQKPKAPSYTLLVVVFMAIVVDLVMVHNMTAAGAPMSQADFLNLSLPSASLALGTAVTVMKAHQQHKVDKKASSSFERPVETHFNDSTSEHFERSSDEILETWTIPRWPDSRQLQIAST